MHRSSSFTWVFSVLLVVSAGTSGHGAVLPDLSMNNLEFSPARVEFHPSGNVYASDPDSHVVRMYGPSGTLLDTITLSNTSAPFAMCFLAGGRMAVSDLSDGSVDIYDAAHVWEGSCGSGAGEFDSPVDIVYKAAINELFVLDSVANNIRVFTGGGAPLRTMGASGTGDAQFISPVAFALQPGGNELYIADQGNSRVQVLDLAGSYIRQVGSAGSLDGQFVCMQGIEADEHGFVFVSDTFHNTVQILDTLADQFIVELGVMSSIPGQGLLQPHGIAFDRMGQFIFVASHNTQSIEVFDISAYTLPPSTVADWAILE